MELSTVHARWQPGDWLSLGGGPSRAIDATGVPMRVRTPWSAQAGGVVVDVREPVNCTRRTARRLAFATMLIPPTGGSWGYGGDSIGLLDCDYTLERWLLVDGDVRLYTDGGIRIDAAARRAMLLAPVGTTARLDNGTWRLTFPDGEQA